METLNFLRQRNAGYCASLLRVLRERNNQKKAKRFCPICHGDYPATHWHFREK